MKNKLTFKETIKQFLLCGLSILALFIIYKLLELFFGYISENQYSIILTLSNINSYFIDNLKNIILYNLLAQAWFFCCYFKLGKTFEIPNYINLIYYIFITLNIILLLFSIINLEIIYAFLFLIINLISPTFKEKNEKFKDSKQLEMDI